MLTFANLTLPKDIALLPLGYIHLIGCVKSVKFIPCLELMDINFLTKSKPNKEGEEERIPHV